MQTSLSFGISGVNPEGCAIWLNVASGATRGVADSAAGNEASGARSRVRKRRGKCLMVRAATKACRRIRGSV
jgi:hypothetical protein